MNLFIPDETYQPVITAVFLFGAAQAIRAATRTTEYYLLSLSSDSKEEVLDYAKVKFASS